MLISYYNLSVTLLFIVLFAFNFTFGLSTGSVVPVIKADILPDIGVVIAVMFWWLFVIYFVYMFPIFLDNFGIAMCFCIFLVISICGLFFMIFVVNESKGKTQR